VLGSRQTLPGVEGRTKRASVRSPWFDWRKSTGIVCGPTLKPRIVPHALLLFFDTVRCLQRGVSWVAYEEGIQLMKTKDLVAIPGFKLFA